MANKASTRGAISEVEESLRVENTRLKQQLADQMEELALAKKGVGVLCEEPEVKYAFIE